VPPSVATTWLNALVDIYHVVLDVTPADDQESVSFSTVLATKVKHPAFDTLPLSDQRDLLAACFIAVDRYNARHVPDHRTPYLLKEARSLGCGTLDAIIDLIGEIDADLRQTRSLVPAG
jgi:hypothetical protein